MSDFCINQTAVYFYLYLICSLTWRLWSWVGHRFKNTAQTRSDKNTTSQQPQPAPVYEEIQPTFTLQDQEKAFKLNDDTCIAYVHYICNDYTDHAFDSVGGYIYHVHTLAVV